MVRLAVGRRPEHLGAPCRRMDVGVDAVEVAVVDHPELVAAVLRFEHERVGGVLVGVDERQRVHHDADAERTHAASSVASRTTQVRARKSCQPRFRGVSATRMKPNPRKLDDTAYPKVRTSARKTPMSWRSSVLTAMPNNDLPIV